MGELKHAVCFKPNLEVLSNVWLNVQQQAPIHKNGKDLPKYHGPGIDSTSNRNEYQVYFQGVKAAGA
jgi:hypothetical protein